MAPIDLISLGRHLNAYRDHFLKHQLLFRVTGWREKGWRDSRWIQIIIFTSTKSRQVNRVNAWCQNHVNAKIKAAESNPSIFCRFFWQENPVGNTFRKHASKSCEVLFANSVHYYKLQLGIHFVRREDNKKSNQIIHVSNVTAKNFQILLWQLLLVSFFGYYTSYKKPT